MRRALLVLFVALVATMPSAAGAAQGGGLRVNNINVKDYPNVAVTVTAPQALAGRPLSEDAFSVVERQNEVAVSVEPITNDTLRVVMVMDTSGSMQGEPMAAAKDAAADFVRQLPGGTQLSVVSFASEANVVTPFSDDADRHARAIQGLVASGETALYDGLIMAAEQFRTSGDSRRAIVLLSDGGDTVSDGSFDGARRKLQRSDAAVYGIRYQTSETNGAALDGLAVRGRVIGADSAQGLTQVYDTIANELVSQYRVEWTSTARGTTPATITVTDGTVQESVTVSLPLPAPPLNTDADPAPPPEPAPVPVPEGQTARQGLLASQIAMLVGAALFFIGTALLLLLLVAPRRRRVNILNTAAATAPGISRSLSELAEHAVHAAERGLERRNLTSKLNATLESAGVNLRPAEFLVLIISAALTAFAFGMTSSGVPMGLALAGVVGILSRVFLTIKADRRRAKFGDQLNETLQLLSGSLRAGYGMLQAIDSVAQEAPEPTAHEFRRLVVESRLGRDMTAALEAMAARLKNDDFEWVVQAIMIHREVGGDLAEVLDTVAGTIRERNQIRRQIKALSAEGKLSGVILGIVPPAVGVLIAMVNPGYMNPLFTTVPGRVALGVGMMLMIAGALWMKKLVRLVF